MTTRRPVMSIRRRRDSWLPQARRCRIRTRRADSGAPAPVHDRPRRLDRVLAREQRRISLHRVADEALVRVEAIARLVLHHRQLDGLAEHALSGPLRAGADRDAHLRRQREAHVIAVRQSWLRKDDAGRRLQLDEHLGARGAEALAGGHVKRHALPAPRIDEQIERGVSRNVRALA